MVLVQVPFPSVWDQADTLPVEMSTMSPELFLTPAMMVPISVLSHGDMAVPAHNILVSM